jgi:tRNA threonylcarbamoyl adenosine modification protein (Sua5/YciO/YrdC/YwlC family)
MITFQMHPVNPQRRYLDSVIRILKDEGGIAVYPTDTVYGMGSSISNPNAIERIGRILSKDKTRTFSFICSDFSQISDYARVSNTHFKLMKRYLPGPYTFILPATNLVPKKVCPKRKTVGIRIPSCTVLLELVNLLGEPLANTSINLPGDLRGDPEEVRIAVHHEVDVMLDIGCLDKAEGSTVVDLTEEEPVLIREGKGKWNE